ncbi:histidine kinase [Salinimicrobium tongyeongense]|uniref:Histidine kinase n=1 Tax=Salinimicrobium tongyeongense TaxID=2809707 RepID=A0ABY6NUV5_9FLAO|nr:histidine kinase [Salinimicrobium tongyeongense]UZH56687.1 histidine kinase [Salinimicrobium tongyeongense]
MILQKHFDKVFSSTSGYYKIGPEHHILFWMFYFLFNVLRWGSYYDDYLLSLKGNIIGFPIHMLLSYITIYIFIPKFIEKRRFFTFAVSLIASIFLMVRVKFDLTSLLVSTNVWPEGPVETTTFTFNYVITMMLGEFYVISFVTALKITIDWMQESKRVAKLQKTQLETELKFLRSQISPHFFFNTLNNIYSLSLEKSVKASETILKLSELMRYLLYETTENKQDLQKEIICIQNYLDLEKIRYGDLLQIKMSITGDIAGKKVSSMLLIPFIENAIKHGANKTIGKTNIIITFTIQQDFLHFKIVNTLPPQSPKSQIKQPGGIGIANVRKRLELAYRKDEYELQNYEEKNRYIVELKLKLR